MATTGISGDNIYRLRIGLLNEDDEPGFGGGEQDPGCRGEVLDLEITVTDLPDIDLTVQPTTVYEGSETVITVTAAGNDAMPLYNAATTIVFTPAGGGSDPAESNDYSVDSAALTLEIPACATLESGVCDEADPANTNRVTGTFTLTIPTDTNLEGDETLLLTASASTPSATPGDPLVHDFTEATTTVTIADVFSVSFSSAEDDPNVLTEGLSVSEDAGEIEFVVTVDPAPVDRPVTVTYATSNSDPPSAMVGLDYTETMGVLTFDPGETTKTIPVPIIDDEAPEEDETFTLTLSQLSGNGIVMDQTVTITILANDAPAVQFVGDDPAAMEDGGEIVFSVEITGDVSSSATVEYQTQTANPPTVDSARSEAAPGQPARDYETTSGTLTFTSSLTTAAVTVPLVADDTHETNETFTMRLFNHQGAILGTKRTATGTITNDDDAPVLSIRGEANREVAESIGSIVLTVEASNRSARETTVTFQTESGSATADDDFTSVTGTLTMTADSGNLHAAVATGATTATAVTVTVPSDQAPAFPITIPIADDAGTEDETFTFSLAEIPSATDPSGLDNAGVGPAVTVTILELKPSFGSNMVPDQVYSLGEDVDLTLPTVDQAGNGATAYALTPDLPAGLTFDANTRVISGAPTESRDETAYTYTASDEDGDPAVIMFNITVTAPVLAFVGDDPTAMEDDGEIVFSIEVTGDVSGNVTVEYQTQTANPPAVGSARSEAAPGQPARDYETTSGTLTFTSSLTTAAVTVPLVADDTHETNETFTIRLFNQQGANLGTKRTATGTITNDDNAPVLSIRGEANRDVAESAGSIVLTVEASNRSARETTVTFQTESGSATAGEDFTSVTGTLTMTADSGNLHAAVVTGAATAAVTVTVSSNQAPAFPITIPITADAGTEDETFTFSLAEIPSAADPSGLANAGVGTAVTVTILELKPSFGSNAVSDQVYSLGGSVDLTLPMVDQAGNGATTYALTPDLPAGLMFDADARTISGAPTESRDETPYTYTATDEDGDPATIMFNITVTAPVLAFVGDDPMAMEDDGEIVFSVEVTGDVPGNVTVEYQTQTANPPTVGSARSEAAPNQPARDYETTSGTLTFTSSLTTASVTVPLVADDTHETNETFTMRLFDPQGAILGTKNMATGTITDDDNAPVLSILGEANREVAESDGSIVLTVEASNRSARETTVTFQTASGNATAPEDFTSVTGTLTMTADSGNLHAAVVTGAATAAVTVTVPGDQAPAFPITIPITADVETEDETFTFSLAEIPTADPSGLANAGVGTAVTVTILELKPSFGSNAVSDQVYSLGGSVDLTLPMVDRAGNGATTYALTPDLPAGLMFDADARTISGTPTELRDETAYTYTATDEDGDPATITFNITVTAPGLAFVGDDPTAMEDDGEIVFSVRVTGEVPGEVTVEYQTQTASPPTVGSARSEAAPNQPARDYESTSGTLTFTSSLTAASVTVPLVADDTHETDETFTMRLFNPQGANLGTKNMATGTITDDDNAPVLSIRGEANPTVTEGDGSIVLTVEASNRSARETTVTFQTASGSAMAGEDFTSVTGTLTMTADSGNLHAAVVTGAATAAVTVTVPSDQAPAFPITIPIAADAETEDETFTFSLAEIPAATDPSGLDNARVGTAVTVTILELKPSFGSNTVPDQGYSLGETVDLTLPAVDREGNGATVYALTPDLPAGLTFDADTRVISGTPTESRDETPYTYTATDEDGDTATIMFNIAVAASDLAFIGDDPTAMEGDGEIVFSVEVTGDVSGEVTVEYRTQTVDPPTVGSARSQTAPNQPARDYETTSGTLTFTSSLTAAAVTVPLVADDTHETDETFTMRLVNPQGAILGTKSMATGTITDDDNAPVLSIRGEATRSVTEGDGSIVLTVEASNRSARETTVAFQTASGSATAGEDFTSVTGTLTMTADSGNLHAAVVTGAATAAVTVTVPSDQAPAFPITIPIAADAGTEDETFTFSLAEIPATDPSGLDNARVVGTAVTVTILELKPSFGSNTVSDQDYSLGEAVTLTLPAVDRAGTGATVYTLTPDLPAGLMFDANTRVISGTPTELRDETPYIYTATDADGDTDRITFNITVAASGPVFDQETEDAVEDQSFRQNEPITPIVLPEVDQGGTGTTTYKVEPDLPPGLTFDPDTLTISGTPTVPQKPTTYTYTATDENDRTDTIMFSITVPGPVFDDGAAEDLRYDASEPLVLPEAQGGSGDITYTVEPDLPPGVTFDPDTRTISGTPTGPAGETTYTYTATDEDGNTITITFTIIVPDVEPSFGDETLEDVEYDADEGLVLPEAQGGNGDITYAVEGDLPPGLSFDPDTRTISGAPTGPAGETTLTYTATDEDNETAMITFTIIVPDALPSFGDETLENVEYDAGETFVLPEAQGGNGDITYTVEGDLPPGLSFDPDTRTISGTPTGPAGETTLTYTATDAEGGTAIITFKLIVPDLEVSFGNKTVEPQVYSPNIAIDSLTLPTVEQAGNGATVYRLAPDLPAGLTFDADTRILSGTPTQLKEQTTYTYTAADQDDDTDTITFSITVKNEPPTARASANPTEAEPGQTVTLDGSQSTDPEGGTLTYRWDHPAGITLTGETSSTATFTAPSNLAQDTQLVFTLTVTDPGGLAATADATVTVKAGLDLAMVMEGSLGVFGRSVAASAVDAIGERFDMPSTLRSSELVVVAGRTLNVRGSGKDIGISALRMLGFGIHGGAVGRANFDDAQADGLGNHFGERLHGNGGAAITLPSLTLFDEDLRRNTAFDFGMGRSGGGAGDRFWVLWGRGDIRNTAMQASDTLSLDGSTGTMMIGAELRNKKDVFGAALSQSSGTVDFEDGDFKGEVAMSLTSIFPYWHTTLKNEVNVWTMLGIGTGNAEHERPAVAGSNSKTIDVGTGMLMATVGLRRAMSPMRGFDTALKGDAYIAQLSAEEFEGYLPETDAGLQRLRFGFEASRMYLPCGERGRQNDPDEDDKIRTACDLRMKPSFELNLRAENGIGTNDGFGAGLEIGGGLSYAQTQRGIMMDARFRYLMVSSLEDFNDWGLSFMFRVDPGSVGGMAVSLAPTWGQTSSWSDVMWNDDRWRQELQNHRGDNRSGSHSGSYPGQNDLRPQRVDMELLYSFRFTRWSMEPFGTFGQVRGGHDDQVRMGLRLKSFELGRMSQNIASGDVLLELFDQRSGWSGRDSGQGVGARGTVRVHFF